jgi:hypothetical protein
MMMIVVPAFAEGQQRQPQVVARIIARGIAAAAEAMRH